MALSVQFYQLYEASQLLSGTCPNIANSPVWLGGSIMVVVYPITLAGNFI